MKFSPIRRRLLALAAVLPLFSFTAHAEELQIKDLVEGTGDVAETGKSVQVHYTGWLLDGTKFDSSLDRGTPFVFPLGGGRVIKGWDQGVVGMKVGGKRELIIPADMAYGDRAAGSIPPGSTLKFHVELLKVSDAPWDDVTSEELQALQKEGVVLVDIRRPEEWAATGVIEGSQLITAFDEQGQFLRDFPAKFMAIAGRGDKVALICQQGNRSRVLATVLTGQAGYINVYNVKEGIDRWQQDGLPLVDAPQ